MFDAGTIGLMVSGLVAALQVYSFFDNKTLRKEQSLNTFAKADLVKSDLDSIRGAIDSKLNNLISTIDEQDNRINNVHDEINANITDLAVIKERIANDKELLIKLDEKMDKILSTIK